MRLVPRQLRRYGMTGNVPYYGGRFTPAQAYAISHPHPPTPTSSVPGSEPVPVPAPPPDPEAALGALRELLDSGVITAEEHEALRARMDL